jgi:hypothetical protein
MVIESSGTGSPVLKWAAAAGWGMAGTGVVSGGGADNSVAVAVTGTSVEGCCVSGSEVGTGVAVGDAKDPQASAASSSTRRAGKQILVLMDGLLF